MPDPLPQAEFDAYAANYDEALQRGLDLTGETKDYFAEGRVRWLRQRLAEQGQQPLSCLDFGCGTGTAAPFLQAGLGIRDYIGYDPSAASIQRAEQDVKSAGVRFTHEASSLEPESVELAFCNGVFHHIPPEQRAGAAELVWRTLKRGGFFAFWENNRWNPIVHYIMSRVPFDHDAQMLFPFQARALLRAARFEMVGTDSCFVFPAALAPLRSLEPMLCKLPIGGQYLVLARKP